MSQYNSENKKVRQSELFYWNHIPYALGKLQVGILTAWNVGNLADISLSSPHQTRLQTSLYNIFNQNIRFMVPSTV